MPCAPPNILGGSTMGELIKMIVEAQDAHELLLLMGGARGKSNNRLKNRLV